MRRADAWATLTRATEQTTPSEELRTREGAWRFRGGALIALAGLVGLVLWLALRDTGGKSSPAAGARAVGIAQIRSLAASVGHAVFWVGPRAGSTYELTQTSNGSIYIRYLPPGQQVGTKTPYLTVATYPFPDAFAAIRTVSKQRGVTTIKLAHGGLAETSGKDPQRVHAAFPGVDYQVEVYDPTASVATGLVATGRLAALGKLEAAAAAPAPKAVSPAALRALAGTLGHPIYWVGPKSGYRYELTQTADGKTYIRYLPSGVRVGALEPYLTIATYPFHRAYAAVVSVAAQSGADMIKLADGGRAVVNASKPTSIYAAYPGSDYEIEVFDPSAARARRIVASDQIRTIG